MNDEGDDDETLPLNGHALHSAGDGGGVYGGGRAMLIYKGIEDLYHELGGCFNKHAQICRFDAKVQTDQETNPNSVVHLKSFACGSWILNQNSHVGGVGSSLV